MIRTFIGLASAVKAGNVRTRVSASDEIVLRSMMFFPFRFICQETAEPETTAAASPRLAARHFRTVLGGRQPERGTTGSLSASGETAPFQNRCGTSTGSELP